MTQDNDPSRRKFIGMIAGVTAIAASGALRSALAAQAPRGLSFDVDTSPGAAQSAIDFRGRGGTFAGRDAVLAFYRGVKSKMRETLTLRGLVVDQRQWVADVVTELYAQEDWPDFPTGAMGARPSSTSTRRSSHRPAAPSKSTGWSRHRACSPRNCSPSSWRWKTCRTSSPGR